MSTLKTVNVVHPSSATNNIELDASGNATINNNLTVTGAVNGTVVMPSSFLRNRIINGGMRIAQRGTSFTSPASGTYTVDRWFVGWTGAAPASVSQITGPIGYQNALRITGAASNTMVYASHRIESNNIADLAGTTVTLSATITVSANQTVLWAAWYPTATDNYTSFTLITTGTWSATTTATRFSAQIALPANVSNGLMIAVYPQNGGAFTSGTFDVTGVQVEAGSVATPFERRQYGQELALCQRYLFRPSTNGTTYGFFASGAYSGVTSGFAFFPFPVSMRTTPTFALDAGRVVGDYAAYSAAGGAYNACSSLSINAVSNPSGALLNIGVASGGTAGQVLYFCATASSNISVQFSAEL